MNNLLIYGPPASGKSYIGKFLANLFGVQFIDVDKEIEYRTNDKIEEIISILGQDGFRRVEADILQDVILTHSNAIVSLGGGALLNDESRKIAEKENTVICLNWSREILEKNFSRDHKTRPLCKNGIEEYRKLLDERKQHYDSFEYQIVSAHLDKDLNLENGISNVIVGKVFSKAISSIIGVLFQKKKISIVYDRNVESYASKIFDGVKVHNSFVSKIPLDIKETSKNLDTVHQLLDYFDSEGISRNDIVVSIGGGITSDIVGFSSSIWKRGIKWISIPTTLLSMIDASIGGKTGVNFKDAKNLVGAFHKPAITFIDCQFLRTLDKKHIVDGYAEAYKHFLLDEELIRLYSDSQHDIVQDLKKFEEEDNSSGDLSRWKILSRFLNTKLKIVMEDPLENNGSRQKLNVGHTIAHAIEVASNYQIPHGQAVSIGLCEEIRIAKQNNILKSENLLADVRSDLNSLGLQVDIPSGIEIDKILEIAKKDKKNDGFGIKFILFEQLGKTIEYYI